MKPKGKPTGRSPQPRRSQKSPSKHSSPHRSRRTIRAVLLGGAIALVTGGALGYFLVDRRTVAVQDVPPGVDVLPQNTLMAVSLSTDPTQWRRLRALGTPASRAVLDEQLVQWRDRLLTHNGLQINRAATAWLGSEVTLALLPSTEDLLEDSLSVAPPPSPDSSEDSPDAPADDEAEGEPALGAEGTPPEGAITELPTPSFVEQDAQRPLLAVLPVTNVEQAQQVLADLSPPQTTASSRTYRGQAIREFVDGDRTVAAMLLGDRYLILTNQSVALDAVIDTAQGEPSLEQIATYGEALRDVAAPQPLARLYLNGPGVKELAIARSAQPAPLLGLSPIQRNQGVAATLSLEASGLRLRGMGWLPLDGDDRHTVSNQAGGLLDLLPDDALMVVSGDNFKEFWETYRQQPVANPRNPLNPNTLQEAIVGSTGLALDQDFVNWMDGEFALALVAIAPDSSAPEAFGNAPEQAGLVLMAESSDRPTTENTLKRLDDVMGNRYRYQISAADIGGQPVVNWVSRFGSLTASHGWLDGRTAFFVLGTSVVNALLPAPAQPLSASDLAIATQSLDLTAYNSRVLIDVEQLRQVNRSIPIPLLPQLPDSSSSDAILEAMRQIGVTSAIRSDRTTQFDVRVLLKREGEPQPLPPPGTTPAPANGPDTN